MTSRPKRYNLLLDEMLPRKEEFPLLNRMHSLRHITHDLHKSGSKDIELVNLASKLTSIIITKNIKHFKNRCAEKNIDMIGVAEDMLPEELDRSIMAILRKRKQKSMTGQFTKISHPPRKQP